MSKYVGKRPANSSVTLQKRPGAAHSWFNRFRKLLVRYEKLDHSFIALNHLAASIIAFRKVKLAINIIYG
jgi:hypothetical protein